MLSTGPLLIFLIAAIYAGELPICNECDDSIKVNDTIYDIRYVQCTFDTTFSVSKKIQEGENIDWLLLGTACDDRCPTNEIGEGYLCSKDMPGYYEIENGVISNPVNKIEFHHYNCTITEDMISLHVHRFLPNFWLKNISIPYFIADGKEGEFDIKKYTKFVIDY